MIELTRAYEQSLKIIMQLVTISSLAVLVNENSSKFFEPSRGLRQGDPISLILLTDMADSLGRYIGKLVLKGEIQGVRPTSQPLLCSHEKFVDDTIFKGKFDVREARSLKKPLNLYWIFTGKLVNQDKSSLFLINTHFLRKQKIANILGCSIGSFPRTYLGLPLGFSPSKSFWEDLVEKFNKKLVGWKGNMLSQVGKVTLLKACLQTVPTYALSLFKLLAKFLDAIDKIQRNFLWSSTKGK